MRLNEIKNLIALTLGRVMGRAKAVTDFVGKSDRGNAFRYSPGHNQYSFV